MVFTLKNDAAEAKINSKGAELVSLKKGDREYMWQADPAYWGRTSPVLFPFVGSLKKKEYRYQGISYPMGQHGFARDMEFELVFRTDTKLVMALEETEETLAKYPFCFRLEISYELSGASLSVDWKVTNVGDGPMYFSIGAHPAFNCPLDGAGKQSDYTLRFLKDEKPLSDFTSAVIGEGGLVVEGILEFGLENGHLPITPDLFDTNTLVLEGGQTDAVSLYDPAGKEYVRVSFDMPLVGIWTPIEKNAPFICIEPWCGRCDDADFEGELPEKAWGNMLESGKEFQTMYSISIF